MADSSKKPAILQGSLDMLILQSLTSGTRHGYDIAKHLREATEDFLQVEEGSLYPALYRLERQKWISAQWGTSESNRKAKYYSLTAAGKKQLQKEMTAWEKMSSAINLVLRFQPKEV